MKRIKITLLTLILTIIGVLFSSTDVKAATNPAFAPADWAFKASSVPLHDKILADYPTLDTNGDGYISITEAGGCNNCLIGNVNFQPNPGLTGTIDGIEYFTKAREINFRGNTFLTGTIPAGIANMTNLEVLNITFSDISGSLPTNIGNLTKLKDFTIIGTDITGAIPNSFGNLTNLENIEIRQNAFTGSIPTSIGNLVKLKSLMFVNERLQTDPIPSAISNCISLEYLYISSNNDGSIVETIPTNIGNLTNLKYFQWVGRTTTGVIPTSIGNLTNLEHLIISSNTVSKKISGTIPTSIGNLNKLKELIISNTDVTGPMPTSIVNLTNLEYLRFSINRKLDGPIPTAIGNLTKLKYLSFENCNLSGTIPVSITNLVNLENLWLGSNQISGEIPSNIDDLSKLKILQLEYNKLSGEIPTSITNMTSLLNTTYIFNGAYFRGNEFTSIPSSVYNFVRNGGAWRGKLQIQKSEETLAIVGKTNNDYTFNGLPVYEQLPNYGVTLVYTLKYPDGTSTVVTPTVGSGIVTIDGSDLTQSGQYILEVNGTSPVAEVTNFEYITNFEVFGINEGDITYDLDGGTNHASNPAKYTYGVGVSAFQAPTRAGYTFIDWRDAANNPITNISTSQRGPITIYAKWKANDYNITYVLNGGVNSVGNPTQYTYGIGVTSFANPTKTGHDFLGWYDAANNKITKITTTDIGAKTLEAKWKASEYNITYGNLGGGTNHVANPTKYTFGVGVASFRPPTRSGYDFVDWVDAGNNVITSISTTSTGNVHLLAKWKACDYNITYNLNGGTNHAGNPTQYTHGVGVAAFHAPTKTGHTFVDWVDASNNVITNISTTAIGNVTLIAKWKANDYNITYNLNGGTNHASNPAKYTYGIGVASFGTPTKTGHDFLGWFDPTNNVITNISTTAMGAITLEAKWKASDYNITYTLNGGTNHAGNPTQYTFGIGVATFQTPTKTGHTFVDWVDASNNVITNISTTATGNKTLIAKWKANDYNITYTLNGGTNHASNPAKYTYGIGVASFGIPTKTGHDFLGWFDPANNAITNISTTAMGAKTLEAKWQVKNYSITYTLNGGTNHAGNPTQYTFGVGVATFQTPTKTGHTFVDWVDASNNVITNISTTATGNKTLIAKWKANDYNITYNLNGGTNHASNPAKYTYGVGVASFGAPTKTGHDFLGWFDPANNAITNISTTAMGAKALEAKWQVKNYSITYDLDGGKISISNPNQYTYGVGVASFKAPTKTGYDFIGWYDSSNAIMTNILVTDLGAKNLKAKWVPKEYKIKYVLDGGVNSKKNPAKYTYGVGVIKLYEPTREGYEFLGWYFKNTKSKKFINVKSISASSIEASDIEYSTKNVSAKAKSGVTSISKSKLGNITLYAKWGEPLKQHKKKLSQTGSKDTCMIVGLSTVAAILGCVLYRRNRYN